MQKILIVEDEPDILALYTHTLTTAGFTVDQAANGVQALTKIKSTTYDLILLDLMLPEKDGVTLLKELKADPTLKSQPVYILTNLGQDSVIKDCFALGAVGFIIKSQIQPADLVKEVTTFFSKPASA